MDLQVLFLGALWLLAAAGFTLFIVFFGRRKYANPAMGFVYLLFFFIVGVSMLLSSMLFWQRELL